VVVGAVDTAAGVRVEVRDSGPGIPADELPFIFDRFWHAQRSSSVRGTGLGLAIAKGIAEAHGTLIAVESTVGAGSTFSVVLPYAAVQAPEPAEGSRTPRGTEAQLS
jgi:signal transduction histidine kinase